MFRKNGMNPALEEPTLDYVLFVLLNRNCRLGDTKNAGGFARRRTNTACELREVVGRMKLANRFLPLTTIDVVVPVGNEVVDRTTGLAERHATIHAASALLAKLLFGKVLV